MYHLGILKMKVMVIILKVPRDLHIITGYI